MSEDFRYSDERFADVQMLRYRLKGFENLDLRQKKYIYCLSQAVLYGRDITFDQYGSYNLVIRKTLEAIVTDRNVAELHALCGASGEPLPDVEGQYAALTEYLKRVWFSNGIYHHYGCDKFSPGFSEAYFRRVAAMVDERRLPLRGGQTVEQFCDYICPVIFDSHYKAKRVNKRCGDDLVATSACNYYIGVSQSEAEQYYARLKAGAKGHAPSYGLNSRLVRRDGEIVEEVYSTSGLYSNALRHIVYWLRNATAFVENDRQRRVIDKLIAYYETGDIRLFDEYSIEWVGALEGEVDFINGFIEVYGDPLGFKGTWEGIVEYKDQEATRRTRTLCDNVQWFEDHSPVDPRFRKPQVRGVSATVICAAMLAGEEYPSSAIGINLPNADWIRAEYGSKSVTIGNLTEAYNKAARGNGMLREFVVDDATLSMIERYGDACDDLHTDLHECLGHGSGRLLPGVSGDALKAYGNTIEEARADLFALYYIADKKLVELGLMPDGEAYKSQYYTYMMNGALTQYVRIARGSQIEEAHMRNRALIARWCIANGDGVVSLQSREGKTYVVISDYEALRRLFATLLADIQRVKSEGDYEAARSLVERYGVEVDPALHEEVLARYSRLGIAPYKGFINPVLVPVRDGKGDVTDIHVDYSESYSHQMLRYSAEYATLI